MDTLSSVDRFYKRFKENADILSKGVYGYSLKKRPLYYFKIGKGKIKIVFTFSIHAREFITSHLALKMIKDAIKTCKKDIHFGTFYFLPCLNPDGVYIAEHIKPLYKANARGVDLNVNFDAKFGKGEKNVFTAGDENYVGKYPFSEPETAALKDFTIKISPDATVSYHTKGEEIYWYFSQNGKDKIRDYAIAKKLAKETGYTLKLTPNSSGGYKDWCIDKLKIPAFTVEAGSDKLTHPIKKESLGEIYRKNKNLPYVLLSALKGK